MLKGNISSRKQWKNFTCVVVWGLKWRQPKIKIIALDLTVQGSPQPRRPLDIGPHCTGTWWSGGRPLRRVQTCSVEGTPHQYWHLVDTEARTISIHPTGMLSCLHMFSLEIKINICKIYTTFQMSFANVQCYIV